MWKYLAFGFSTLLAVPLLLLWGFIGFLLRQSLVLCGLISVAVVLTLTITVQLNEHLTLFDFPVVLAFTFAGVSLIPKKLVYEAPIFALFLAYAIVRRVYLTVENSNEKLYANWIAVLSCIGLLWGIICALKLWVSASLEKLTKIEDSLYKSHIMSEYKMLKVAGLGTVHIPYCGEVRDESRLPPLNLVLIHGYAAGNAFWATNLQEFAKCYNVYAVEWIGVGRSDRPNPSFSTYEDADRFFVDAIEGWRKEIQLDRFVLAGHSMGGIFVTHYALNYPQHVEQLILISPAAVGPAPKYDKPSSVLFQIIGFGWRSGLTPMSLVRFAGPFGRYLVHWVLETRMSWLPDTSVLKTGILNSSIVAEYMYHNWALKRSGEVAMNTHLLPV
ncbi:serine protease family S33 [Thraustotheca clavata]|uniref:Serine protease family S33 n=1 Tax=Thraustotheca clavata TaxID=74557 RepID=A0A1V9Z0A4_9STRA|nr:serine protease family S33 [Thraustotheca clavata]